MHEAGPASMVLGDHGVTPEAAGREIKRAHASSPVVPRAYDGPRITPRATKVLSLAPGEAAQLGDSAAGSAHVLLALLVEGESVAAWALVRLGIDLRDLARDVLLALEVPTEARERYLTARAAALDAGR